MMRTAFFMRRHKKVRFIKLFNQEVRHCVSSSLFSCVCFYYLCKEAEQKVAHGLRNDLKKTRRKMLENAAAAEKGLMQGTTSALGWNVTTNNTTRYVPGESPALLGFASASADSAARSRSDTATPPSCDQEASGKNVPIIGDITLTDNDCLFGRGRAVVAHPRNVKFRQLIGRHKIGYTSLPRRRMKRAVMKQVIDEWRSQVPPGRFLKRDENGLLHEVSQEGKIH